MEFILFYKENHGYINYRIIIIYFLLLLFKQHNIYIHLIYVISIYKKRVYFKNKQSSQE